MKRTLEIRAVLDSELEQFLEKTGLLNKIVQGKILCVKCGGKITVDNLYCLYVEDGVIKVCCDQLSCYKNVVEHSFGEMEA